MEELRQEIEELLDFYDCCHGHPQATNLCKDILSAIARHTQWIPAMNDKIQAAIDALNEIDIEKMSTEQIRNLRNRMIYMLARLANELLVRSED